MKRYKPLFPAFLLGLTAFSFFSCDPDETQTVTTFENVVMEENFDGTELDTSLWSYDIGDGSSQGLSGWGNNELQYYTDRPENVKVEDGILNITARKEAYEEASYTSGRILTKLNFDQKYGRFEARMKLPWGQGLWPAFWLLGADIDEVGWPQTGEIDIMEYRGQEPTRIHGSVHGPGYSGAEAVSKSYNLDGDRFDTDFHVFGIEWGKDYINFYVDDDLYNQITPEDVDGEWVYNKPFYILINMAVGGSFVGSPTEDTVFPQTLEIDYVRAYQAE
jgi:beta-glucanase (GH16 family)